MSSESEISNGISYAELLHKAIEDKDCNGVRYLINQKNIDPDSIRPPRGISALYHAVISDNVEIAEDLLKAGAWVDYGGRIGCFPLFAAVSRGKSDMTKLLLKYRAATELKYVNGNTALLEAAVKNNYELVIMLLNAGSDMYAINNGGNTVLHISAERDLRILREFLYRGFDPNVLKYDGNRKYRKSGFRPLHVTTITNDGGRDDAAELLLLHGADVDIKTSTGRTALHLSAIRNATKVAKVLISHGCDINAISMENEEHKTALAKAVDENNLNMVELLIVSGADLNIPDHYGVTPLFSSVFGKKILISKVLIQAGCDVNQITKNHMSPIEAALQHLGGETPLCAIAMCQMLLLAGCSVNYLKASLKLNKVSCYEISTWIFDPKNLKQLTREKIRSLISKDLNNRICDLPLPQMIINFLLLKDLNSLYTMPFS